MDDYVPSLLPAVSVVEVIVIRDVDIDDIREAVAVATPSAALCDENAQRIAALWRRLPVGEPARCHSPPFGLRFLERGIILCHASLCWKCNNIFGEANGEAFAYSFDAQASISQELLNECRLATGESEPPVHPYFERSAELDQIMQSPYGMEKLTTIWREHYGMHEGQFPQSGVDPRWEILRKEFPGTS
ncbi:MAG: hypothetical protein JWP89_1007 [Schlesneria sp.]|nr:hypothetical protein [Schlesneria sp.]